VSTKKISTLSSRFAGFVHVKIVLKQLRKEREVDGKRKSNVFVPEIVYINTYGLQERPKRYHWIAFDLFCISVQLVVLVSLWFVLRRNVTTRTMHEHSHQCMRIHINV
jgi:hypothetical protein